ncbi:dihydropteroate synthase [Chitinibacter sp. ZOR0017]|uniref:dihydropteroate synthase n=1 Tax=Chitinibacter sp. ZOR0017 TaxID=1339254 RepID=UPI000646325A|nr:dihydropteroate synthase [Chitinibacter sp. ZOR0017]
MQIWQCGRFSLSLERPLVMGILNVTPDSFSDGGRYVGLGAAKARIETMLAAGADIIDIGGESTRPGATPVPLQEELERVLPVLALAQQYQVPISIDTCKTEVMQAALAAGADIINDIAGLEAPSAIAALQRSQAGVCLMHKQGQPQTMQSEPHYHDVVTEVGDYLLARAAAVVQSGVSAARIVLDPGFGFGKTLAHNQALFRAMHNWQQWPYPLLIGVSRKRMLGELTGREVAERMVPSVVAAVLAAQQGAKIIRVHDVSETVDALKIWQGLK